MELTRRDALVAVAASTGGVVTAGELADRLGDRKSEGERLERVLDGLAAATDVVYPSAVSVDDAFLQAYVLGRTSERDAFVRSCADAIATLDRESKRRFGKRFEALSADTRERVMVNAGVGSVTPDPDGTDLERVRYYVVNELLFALFTSPTGGGLLGNENPPGYPGGREAYRRGPDDA